MAFKSQPKGWTPRSTTKQAKKIIRQEIRDYFNPREYGVRDTLSAVKIDADSYNCGDNRFHSNYEKGAGLVDAGCLACYYHDQMKMLGKIYGKDNVSKWDGNKIHSTYRHLIGREYSAMLDEKNKGKK